MYRKIIGNPEKYGYPNSYAEYICDDVNDIELLPVNKPRILNGEYCTIGSKALVSSTNDLYILGNNSKWVFLKKIEDENGEDGGSTTQSVVQPDWNQNDETASDYIKNRPFYKQVVETTILEGVFNFEIYNKIAKNSADIYYKYIPFTNLLNPYTSADEAILSGSVGSTLTGSIKNGKGVFYDSNNTKKAELTYDKDGFILYLYSYSTRFGIEGRSINIKRIDKSILKIDKDVLPEIIQKGDGLDSEIFNNGKKLASKAYGDYSHAEGYYTYANGNYSHAEGCGTYALSDYSHSQGKHSIYDETSNYAHIVGNGKDFYNQSNAHTLDWDGNAWFAGDVYVGSTSGTNKDEGSKRLLTEDDIASLTTGNSGSEKLNFWNVEYYEEYEEKDGIEKITFRGLRLKDYKTYAQVSEQLNQDFDNDIKDVIAIYGEIWTIENNLLGQYYYNGDTDSYFDAIVFRTALRIIDDNLLQEALNGTSSYTKDINLTCNYLVFKETENGMIGTDHVINIPIQPYIIEEKII